MLDRTKLEGTPWCAELPLHGVTALILGFLQYKFKSFLIAVIQQFQTRNLELKATFTSLKLRDIPFLFLGGTRNVYMH